MKAEEIVRDKNFTFIGLATGIQELFHGVSWYYLLVLSYLILQGNLIGFYYFVFVLTLLPPILFLIFLMKRFDYLTAILFLITVSTFHYFISMSMFPTISILNLPFILLFLYSVYEFFKTKKMVYQFLIFLSLGFILKAELLVGLFLLPVFIIIIFASRELKSFISSKKNLFYSLVGLFIPIIPRLLFELKNNFLQTRTILNFLIELKYHTLKLSRDVFYDRINYFWGYNQSIFFDGETKLVLAMLILFGLGILFSYKTLAKVNKRYLIFVCLIIIPLFVLTVFYKDNFGVNYFEELSYFFLIWLLIFFNTAIQHKNKLMKIIPVFILIVMFSMTIKNLYAEFTTKNNLHSGRLKEHIQAANYIFNYYSSRKGYPYSRLVFFNNQCWYIVEHHDYEFRAAGGGKKYS